VPRLEEKKKKKKNSLSPAGRVFPDHLTSPPVDALCWRELFDPSAPAAHGAVMRRYFAMLMVLGAATALQPGLLSSVQQSRPSLAIAMRIRNPRRKGVSSRAEKANGLSIKGGYGRAAPESGAGKQALAEAGAGKLGHVQVLLLKECALGGAGAVLPMSLAEFRNSVERKRVGRLASPREVAEAAASPEGVVAFYATKAAAAQATPAEVPPDTDIE
jgi:hypothetical protein